MPSLAIEKKYYFEQDNFWIGPRQVSILQYNQLIIFGDVYILELRELEDKASINCSMI